MKSKLTISIDPDRSPIEKLRKKYFDVALLSLNPFATDGEKKALLEERAKILFQIYQKLTTRQKTE